VVDDILAAKPTIVDIADASLYPPSVNTRFQSVSCVFVGFFDFKLAFPTIYVILQIRPN
jgi:hypothetical protein